MPLPAAVDGRPGALGDECLPLILEYLVSIGLRVKANHSQHCFAAPWFSISAWRAGLFAGRDVLLPDIAAASPAYRTGHAP